jgi:serine/threonine-protein kinase SRPK3
MNYKNVKDVNTLDPNNDTHVIQLLNCFLHKTYYGEHFCMVFEILGVNLLEIIKRYDYKGVDLDIVKIITK